VRRDAVFAALGAVLGMVAMAVRSLFNRRRQVAYALISTPNDHTTTDDSGAVRSVQCADLLLPDEAIDAIWDPMHLERLARTYWRFLTRATFWTVRVHYREDGRDVKLFGLIPLLSFQAPEYEMSGERGIVRWRIQKGFLVAGPGREGDGYLEIDVQRREAPNDKKYEIAHVEVEVANFYPMLASSIGRWFYENTQSRIHVIVTHGFLRSLARLDLAESRVGRFRTIDELPDPVPAREADAADPARATAAA
jgi:hypothetical protein